MLMVTISLWRCTDLAKNILTSILNRPLTRRIIMFFQSGAPPFLFTYFLRDYNMINIYSFYSATCRSCNKFI